MFASSAAQPPKSTSSAAPPSVTPSLSSSHTTTPPPSKRSKPNEILHVDPTILPFGTFDGSSFFRNKLHPSETFDTGHIALSQLIHPSCEAILATTFDSASPEWLKETFGPSDTPSLMYIRDAMHDYKTKIGKATLDPMRLNGGEIPGWYFVTKEPYTSGILHSKILLLRVNDGLRVIVAGSNLMGQWGCDRDALWLRDFPIGPSGSNNKFGYDLKRFVKALAQCEDSFDFTDKIFKTLLDNVSF